MPHGGPKGPYDSWGFDAEIQLLASRGYGVLQVNFRGSGNYGREFLESGNRRVGRGHDRRHPRRHPLGGGPGPRDAGPHLHVRRQLRRLRVAGGGWRASRRCMRARIGNVGVYDMRRLVPPRARSASPSACSTTSSAPARPGLDLAHALRRQDPGAGAAGRRRKGPHRPARTHRPDAAPAAEGRAPTCSTWNTRAKPTATTWSRTAQTGRAGCSRCSTAASAAGPAAPAPAAAAPAATAD